MWNAVHSGVIYWKKVRQDAQGKICLQVDGTQTHFEESEAIDNIKDACRMLKSIEDSTRPEWDGDLDKEVIVEGSPFYSAIIYQYLKDEIN